MSGYSGTPLAKKLGIKAGHTLCLINPPDHYQNLVAPLPPGIVFAPRVDQSTQVIHLFTTRRAELAVELPRFLATMNSQTVIWVSWPKKASKVPTDITEDVIRDIALPLGLVDIKVCAVDEVWSGLKLVVRNENRK
jgi:hypothetical protein